MYGAAKLQALNAPTHLSSGHEPAAPPFPAGRPSVLRQLPRRRRRPRRFLSLSVRPACGGAAVAESEAEPAGPPSVSSRYTSSVGSSSSSSAAAALQLSRWNLTQRHVLMLNVIACAAAVSATWLFCSAIPTLLAFKRAAESLEKLMDVTREELPDTMAAVRLSGMEISDLTVELSDLGQDITQGVRSSTRAVRIAEERLRQLTNMAPPALLQGIPRQETEPKGPALARTAKELREGIVKSRSVLQALLTLTRFSRLALNYFAGKAKR
ncbi:uncharacterized protein LOC104420199 isoform X1 [Eucalyptus grandis]|uniref:uncharacterized protein LOC104420199 isoform X1 n=1 Tax=Eucalyptus grandis TaxID=71139 RepID=UPI00192F0195|nr:uncharacterized protein LOC104420199 isoform X1 [Eucalyptus grandis]